MQLHSYQLRIVDFIKQKKHCAIYADMGLGKTAATLTAIKELYEARIIRKVLIIAPKRVIEHTWPQEIGIWAHTLTYADIRSAKKRDNCCLIDLINRERIVDLISKTPMNYDCIVIDESSSFKSYKSRRFKALRALIDAKHIPFIIELTATPAPNSLEELWGQIYLLDRGIRLGRYITHFRNTFSYKKNMFSYEIKPEAKQIIWGKIKDICFSLKASDYLDMPKLIINDIVLTLPSSVQRAYKAFEKTFCLDDITAINAAVLTNKLLQYANGFLYKDNGCMNIHDEKLEALEEILSETSSNVIVAYPFINDKEKIKSRFKHAVSITDNRAIDRWNNGEIKLLLAHPASAGHGLNLQAGGHTIVWYGLTWSFEQYEQLNGRIHRQGQKNTVVIHRIIAKNTIDELVATVLAKKLNLAESLKDYLTTKH